MKTHKLLLLALASTWVMGASAQWQWTDAHGRKVFSDRPPPQDIPEKNILKQPRYVPRAINPAPADANPEQGQADAGSGAGADAPAAAQPPVASGKDAQLEKNKAKAEAAEAAKKQAEEKAQADRQAKAKADNCARAQQAKATLESGRMLSHINAQGERGFMDEATRKAELDRAQKVINSDCKS